MPRQSGSTARRRASSAVRRPAISVIPLFDHEPTGAPADDAHRPPLLDRCPGMPSGGDLVEDCVFAALAPEPFGRGGPVAQPLDDLPATGRLGEPAARLASSPFGRRDDPVSAGRDRRPRPARGWRSRQPAHRPGSRPHWWPHAGRRARAHAPRPPRQLTRAGRRAPIGGPSGPRRARPGRHLRPAREGAGRRRAGSPSSRDPSEQGVGERLSREPGLGHVRRGRRRPTWDRRAGRSAPGRPWRTRDRPSRPGPGTGTPRWPAGAGSRGRSPGWTRRRRRRPRSGRVAASYSARDARSAPASRRWRSSTIVGMTRETDASTSIAG